MTSTRWPESRAPRGMVATPHRLASQSGVATLRAGGNALDAAIAAAATIAVVYPHMNGLGGDNLWLIYDAGARALKALCGVGRPALARTLEAVRDGGAEVFYQGEIARRIVAAARAAGSPLGDADFAQHRSDWMDPVTIEYAGGRAASFPPPAQGLSALALLTVAERFDMAALAEADYVHVVVEAAKLAFADRDRYLTDPDFMRITPAELLDRAR